MRCALMLVSALLIVTWACTIMFVFSLFLLYHILFLWASMEIPVGFVVL